MAKDDAHAEAEKLFPGDRVRQDAYLAALGAGDRPKPKSKSKTPAKKKAARKAAPPARRRRF